MVSVMAALALPAPITQDGSGTVRWHSAWAGAVLPISQHQAEFLSEHPVALRCLSYLISCYSDKHVCFTFGFSFLFQGFGRAKHSVTTEKLKAKYPDYEITWADEGY
uniref:14 kDa phosphohistidine phosphatase n=1 Tax=Anas platyrhynchos platyrhynchos TaxID=8840 RepID=A0A493TCI2_ANAPP